MRAEELVELFDQQAAGYDRQWARTAPTRDCMYLLLDALFAGLPAHARVLCVGVGTGVEMAHLARTFPGWTFTAVEPSGAMLEACRRRAGEEGFAQRCRFHEGFLDTLDDAVPYDAATAFLVSQFLLDRGERVGFFDGIRHRLRPGGVLASSDLASDMSSPEFAAPLPAWMRMMANAEVTPEAIERMRAAYGRDVAIQPPGEIAAVLADAGFAAPLQFFQAGLIHAWYSRRA